MKLHIKILHPVLIHEALLLKLILTLPDATFVKFAENNHQAIHRFNSVLNMLRGSVDRDTAMRVLHSVGRE
jgi:hypothetical protein